MELSPCVLSKEEFASASGTDNKAHLILAYIHPACFDVPLIHWEAITQILHFTEFSRPPVSSNVRSNWSPPSTADVKSSRVAPGRKSERPTDAALHHPLRVGQCCSHSFLSSKGQQKPGALPFIPLKSNLPCQGMCCGCVQPLQEREVQQWVHCLNSSPVLGWKAADGWQSGAERGFQSAWDCAEGLPK